MRVVPTQLVAVALVGAGSVAALAGCGDAGVAAGGPRPSAALVSAGPHPVDWRVVDSAAGSDSVVVLPVVGDDWPCVAYRATASESERRVKITVVRDASGCAGDTSTAKTAPSLPVRLERELGERRLEH